MTGSFATGKRHPKKHFNPSPVITLFCRHPSRPSKLLNLRAELSQIPALTLLVSAWQDFKDRLPLVIRLTKRKTSTDLKQHLQVGYRTELHLILAVVHAV